MTTVEERLEKRAKRNADDGVPLNGAVAFGSGWDVDKHNPHPPSSVAAMRWIADWWNANADAYEAHVVGDAVLIYSGEHRSYWRRCENEDGRVYGCGYARDPRDAGRFTKDEAHKLTSHCGPEKKIQIVNALETIRDFRRVNK